MKEKVLEFLKRDWTLEEKILLGVDVLLAGVLLGWLTSPFKGGMFSNNTIASSFGTEDYTIEEEGEEE